MSSELSNALMTIAAAVAAALPCAILGCFLLLKRMSLLADAIGHGVLPGIVLAVLATGRMTGPGVLVGAILFGLLTAVVSEWLSRRGVSGDASLGVVFTGLFSLGVLLLSMYLRHADIDLHCITFSELEYVPLSTSNWFGVPVPTAVDSPLIVLALVVGFLFACWKETKLATFDAGLAKTQGLPVGMLNYGIVALTAGATVAAFPAFGSVLILGMFVIPPATARLLTDRLATMLVLSAVLAVAACVGGYVLASPAVLGTSVSGMIVLVAGWLFLMALFLAPRHGIFAHALRHFRLADRMAEEEILASLFRAAESPETGVKPTDHAFSPFVLVLARWNLSRRQLVRDGRLTERGHAVAKSVVRAHRLWEAYLEKNFELPLDHLHASATEIEHYLGPELQEKLARELPDRDPHGKAIPPS